MMLRILNVEPAGYSDEARAILASLGELDEKPLDRQELLVAISQYDILIVRLRHHLDRALLQRGTRLQAIVSATTGLDHIDLESAREHGIRVLSLRGETEFLRSIPATAEHTWTLLTALYRNLPQAFHSVCRGEWNRDAYRGHQLADKTLGLVGCGRIGEKVARYGQAFQMRVIAYDPYRSELPDGVSPCDSLHALLKRADVVSLHVPLNEETASLIGPAELACMRPESMLINTARGAVIDEQALLEALQSGGLQGAALDVLNEEASMHADHPLIKYARENRNILITPHIGGATHESMAQTELFMATKLRDFVAQELGSRI